MIDALGRLIRYGPGGQYPPMARQPGQPDPLAGADHPGENARPLLRSVGTGLTSAEHAGWTYNANNELVSCDGVTYEYDANGNMVKKPMAVWLRASYPILKTGW